MSRTEHLIREHLRWLRARGAREATIEHRHSVLTRFALDLDQPIEEVTLADLEDWRRSVAARVTTASLKTYVCQVRAFYQWAFRFRHLTSDPSAELPVPRVPRGRPRPIDEDDLALALRCAVDPVRIWLVLAAFCGLRSGEIATLSPDALHRGRGGYTLAVVGKGGHPRTVPCPAEVAALLRPHLRTRGGGPVFRTRTGRPVDTRYISGTVSRFLDGIGVAATLHQLRHRYGSSMYELSHDLRLVQELLGHADPTTTTIYVQASVARGAKIADQLAQDLRRPHRPKPADGDDQEADDDVA